MNSPVIICPKCYSQSLSKGWSGIPWVYQCKECYYIFDSKRGR